MLLFLVSVVCLNFLLAVFIFLQDPLNNTNRLFSLMSFFASIWTFLNYKIHLTLGLFWIQSSYSIGALLIATGLMWTSLITGFKFKKLVYLFLIIISLCFFLLPYNSNFIPDYFYLISTGTHRETHFNLGLILYSIYYIVTGFYIIFLLFNSIKRNNSENKFKPIYVGAIIALSVTLINSFIFPILGIYISKGVDSFGFLCFQFLVAYSIARHSLFNIRLIIVHIFTFLLWYILLLRLLFSISASETLLNSMILFGALLLGIMLLNSVMRIIDQKNEIQNLTNNLDRVYKD